MIMEALTRCGLDKDLELFPDLQLLKNEDVRLTSSSSPSSELTLDVGGTQVCGDDMEDDLVSYFSRENAPAVSTLTAPSLANKGKAGTVKVVTLRKGISRGGKIIVVEQNKGLASQMNFTSRDHWGEGPTSPTSSSNGDADSQAGGLCMTKNAIAARENRLKKKQVMEKLETRVAELSSENTKLKTEKSDMSANIESLRNEVKYLRAVLANQSTLASLLKKIPTAGFNLTSSDEIKRHPSTRKRAASPLVISDTESEDCGKSDTEESEEECDCHPEKNVCMCTKENRYKRSKNTQSKDDHSYGSNKRLMTSAANASKAKRQRGQRSSRSSSKKAEEARAGVCLHVSGESVSLEFCSSCSNNAANSRKKQK